MNARTWTAAVIKIGDQLAALTTVKARELVDYLQEVHGIEASALPLVLPDKIIDDADVVPEPVAFAVRLDRIDASRRIGMIRLVRELFGLSLVEAKDVVEGLPKIVRNGVSKEEAEMLKTKLEAAGAVVSLV